MDPTLKHRLLVTGINTVALVRFAFLIYTKGESHNIQELLAPGLIWTRWSLFFSSTTDLLQCTQSSSQARR